MKRLSIKLSPLAEVQLEHFQAYYMMTFGLLKSEEIIDDIEEVFETLRDFPGLGKIEPLLSDFPQCFRSFVQHPNLKIIYWVEDGSVKIALLFHTRQAQETLRYTIESRTDWVCEPPPPPYGKQE
ncbi:type II toxin-antitoxin system RelE/ParE family toxin [Parabacteroides sp.]